MNSEQDDMSQYPNKLRTQLAQQLASHGLDNLPESELPAIAEAWLAIGDHAATLARYGVRSGS